MAFLNVSSWGRLNREQHDVFFLTNREEIKTHLKENKPGIAYGMGRSYGDVCLNPDGVLWQTRQLDRLINFDEQAGRLTCEAGVLLRDIQQLMIPRGWALPVTPGTEFVTVGGAIANDVHGKNHHYFGSFGNHVSRIQLIRTDGSIIHCGPELLPDWFAATVGGLGLTGLITEAELQLLRVTGPWLDTETIPFLNLSEFFQLADSSENEWEYTVAWIDCLSKKDTRGMFMRANPSKEIRIQKPKKSAINFSLQPPFSLINSYSLKLFNEVYFNVKKRRAGKQLMHYQAFFYPLDHIRNWNRIYGRKGFYQHQSVIPKNQGQESVQAMLHEIAQSETGSFLAVLKTFGSYVPCGMLSFPMHGVTFALDFPNQGIKTRQLFNRLNKIVGEAGGRIYPAKDACMPQALFAAGYPRLAEFQSFRDPGMSSSLSRRLMGS
ncbi:MAG: FAD-binding oxidoreductase [Legionella sp.]